MVTYYETSIAPAVERLVSGGQENKFTIVKHYNTFEITSRDAEQIRLQHPGFRVCYKHFNGAKMIDAFEPFLAAIKDVYETFEAEKTPQEFISQFEIYFPQHSVFESLLAKVPYRRKEDILLDELEYEKEQMIKSLVAILAGLAKKYPLLFLLNNVNMASQTTILLLNKLFEEDRDNIFVYGTFNELYTPPTYMIGVWEKFVENLEDYSCIVDAGAVDEIVSGEEGSYFRFESGNVEEYLRKLKNMYQFLDFEQAGYYLAIIYRKIEVEKTYIDEKYIFEFYVLYAVMSVYSDVPNALLLCDKLQLLLKRSTCVRKKFQYYYILGQAQMYNGNLNAAKECADKCAELAKEELGELGGFKAELLGVMVRMSGWHNIFFCKSNIDIAPEFIARAMKFGYINHLAYTYIFAYDNEVRLLAEGENIGENLIYFQKGVEIAKRMGNEHLLNIAYRKNIMLSSSHGLFDVANFYYNKSMEIVRDKDPEKLANIYNGLGYGCCATEKYEEANVYYNKALVIFYQNGMMNYVGETLYNMAINCMLAGEYEAAYNYLQACIRIINILHLNDLRVCNISKIFGLVALCCYRLGMGYNTRIYLDNTMQFLGHTFIKNNQADMGKRSLDLSYTACDDDIFLYYYVCALLAMDNKNYEKALDLMETARVYVERSIGNQFFSKVQYEISLAELFRKMGRDEEAQRELENGIAYAKRCQVREKLQMLEAVKNGRQFEQKHAKVAELTDVTLLDIQTATKQAGVVKNYQSLKKRMEFSSVWQKIIDISGKDFSELVNSSLSTFMLNFNIDVMSYIRYKEGKATVCFDTKETPLTEQEVKVITDYFATNRAGFVTSKLRKNHKEYNRIISVFGKEQVCSMVCLPYYINEKLDSIFIMYILMKDNWNAPTTKFMLDESDMEFFNLILLQLQNAIEKLENEEQIRQINSQLEKSAITDYLTGLYNRDGFYQNVKQWIADRVTQSITFLYIDLDNFKYYNDTFGHAVGDRILKEIAEILRGQAKEGAFPVRFGGDEFLITLPFEDKEKSMELGRQVLQTIKDRQGFTEIIEPLIGKIAQIPEEKQLSCSIGIAAVDKMTSEERIAEALQKADAVLYSIKHSTKGDVKYSE